MVCFEKQDDSSTGILSKKRFSLDNRHVSIYNLSEDLLIEILSRLPRKPLVRFKCICKTWNCLISTIIDSQRRVFGLFYQSRIIYSLHSLYGVGYEQFNYVPISNGRGGDDSIIDAGLSFLPCYPDCRIADYRNGFLLCSAKKIDRCVYYICNPVTRQCVALPKPQRRNVKNVFAALAFLSHDCRHYKVIQFFNSLIHGKIPVKSRLYFDVYYSETGRWVESNVPFNCSIRALAVNRTVFLNGALYLHAHMHHVIRFDVKEERCQVIELPTESYADLVFPCRTCLGESEGHLNFAYHNGSIMKIWVLEVCESSGWVLKHSISIHAFEHVNPIGVQGRSFNVLAFHPNSDEVFLRVGDKILSYNLCSETLEMVCTLSWEDVDHLSFWVYPFSECLSSVEGTFQGDENGDAKIFDGGVSGP